jgi:hypothetical protein
MSTFEFISVLLAIVVGLGLTRLLTGVGRAMEIRRDLRFYWVQGVWVVNIGLILVVFWWADLFSKVDREVWLAPNFALMLFYAILLFLQAVLIIPADMKENPDLQEHFFEVRPWFFTLGALAILAEFGDTLLHGGFSRVLWLGPVYVSLLSSVFALNIIGARTTNRRFHSFFAIYYFLTLTGWMIIRFWAIEAPHTG